MLFRSNRATTMLRHMERLDKRITVQQREWLYAPGTLAGKIAFLEKELGIGKQMAGQLLGLLGISRGLGRGAMRGNR